MFYTYCQNNSGGSFISNKSVAEFVIISANDIHEANRKAEEIGIYFNGVYDGIDCDCCGDRWYSPRTPTRTPKIYGKAPRRHVSSWFSKNYCIIYYKNGKKKIL